MIYPSDKALIARLAPKNLSTRTPRSTRTQKWHIAFSARALLRQWFAQALCAFDAVLPDIANVKRSRDFPDRKISADYSHLIGIVPPGSFCSVPTCFGQNFPIDFTLMENQSPGRKHDPGFSLSRYELVLGLLTRSDGIDSLTFLFVCLTAASPKQHNNPRISFRFIQEIIQRPTRKVL